RIKFAIQVSTQASGRGSALISMAIISPRMAAITVPTTVTNSVTWRKDRNIVGRTSQAKSQRQKLVVSSTSGVSRVSVAIKDKVVAKLIETLQTQLRLHQARYCCNAGWGKVFPEGLVLGPVGVLLVFQEVASTGLGRVRLGNTQ